VHSDKETHAEAENTIYGWIPFPHLKFKYSVPYTFLIHTA
jgi:hypothetical protein